MTEIRIGCSGWSYAQWVGPFYPKGTRSSDFLKVYSRVFDTVEIDSTFYRIPGKPMIDSWRNSTPEGFLFCPKVPKEITHDMRLRNANGPMNSFLDSIRELKEKLGLVLLQLPPSFTYSQGHEDLSGFLDSLPADLDFAIEFRGNSWFRDEVFESLRNHNVTLAWPETTYVDTPAVLTTSTVYLRLVGDRSLNEESFGKVQREMNPVIDKWSKVLNEKKHGLDHVFAFANNHFQGFGPATVNSVRKSLGMEPVNWVEKMNTVVGKSQKTLF